MASGEHEPALRELCEQLEKLSGPADAPCAPQLALALNLTANVIVCVLDRQRRLVYANRHFECATGFPLTEVRGQDWFDAFVFPDDADHLQARFASALVGTPTRGTINPIKTRDGHRLVIEWYDQPVLDADGTTTGLLCIGHDVTLRANAIDELERANRSLEEAVARRTAELADASAAARASEDKYRTLVESLDDCIYRMELPSGRYEYMSPAATNVFGYAADDFLDKPVFIKEILSPAFHDYFKEQWSALIAGNAPPTYDYRIRRPDGRETWVTQTNKIFFDDAGAAIAIEGVCRDSTGEHDAEEALKTSNQLLEATFQATTVCLAYLDRDFNFLRVNAPYAAADGKVPADFVGKNHFDLYPNADNERIFREVRDSGFPYEVTAKAFEYAHNKDRGITHWDWRLTPIKTSAGEVSGLVLALQDVSPRVNALQAVHEREERLKEAEAIARLGSWELNLRSSTMTWSDGMYSLLGLRKDDSAPSLETLLDCVDERDQRRLSDALTAAIEHGRAFQITHRLRSAMGADVYVQQRSRIETHDGKPARVLGTLQDVTADIRAQADTRVKDAAIESSISAVAIGDPRGLLTYVNQAFADLWRLPSKEAAVGKHATTFWADPDAATRVLKEVLGRGAAVGRLVGLRADGEHFTAELAAHSVFDPSGELMCVMSSFVDVTAQERAERRLAVSEEQFRAAFDQVSVGMFLADVDCQITRVNERLCSICELSESELLARRIEDLIHPSDQTDRCFVEGLLLPGGPPRRSLETRLALESGTTTWISMSISVRHEGGKPVQFLGVVQDITAAKESEQRIAQQLAEKEILLREIHHRVKNNLQVISSLLYFQASQSDDERVTLLFNESRDRVQAMALVHETLYESGNLGRVDFARYIQSLVSSISASYLSSKPIDIITKVEAPSLDIQQAMPCGLITSELVTNAFKYAFPKQNRGTIRVTLTTDSKGLMRLCIADDGIGMCPSDVATPSTLGLRLVRALSEQIGGSVDLNVDAGTEFSIVFPARRQPSESALVES